jgi:hypothetical protein
MNAMTSKSGKKQKLGRMPSSVLYQAEALRALRDLICTR